MGREDAPLNYAYFDGVDAGRDQMRQTVIKLQDTIIKLQKENAELKKRLGELIDEFA